MEDFDFNIDETEFESANSGSGLVKSGISRFSGNPAKIAKDITENINKTIEFCEQQKTKREEIRAKANVYISQINAQRDFLLKYLDRTFDERKQQFEKYFEILDKGIDKGDVQAMSIALQQINQLTAASPFKSLESTQDYVKGLLGGQQKLDF